MGHLGKSVEFWTKALALHDDMKALGGEKKRIELAEGLQAAMDRDSGKEALLAKAKAKEPETVEVVEGDEDTTIDNNTED